MLTSILTVFFTYLATFDLQWEHCTSKYRFYTMLISILTVFFTYLASYDLKALTTRSSWPPWPPFGKNQLPLKVRTYVCQNIGFKLCWPQLWQYFSPTLLHLTSRLWPHDPHDLNDLHKINFNQSEDIVHQNIGFKLCWSQFWKYFSSTLPHMTSRLWPHDPHDLNDLHDLHFVKINYN